MQLVCSELFQKSCCFPAVFSLILFLLSASIPVIVYSSLSLSLSVSLAPQSLLLSLPLSITCYFCFFVQSRVLCGFACGSSGLGKFFSSGLGSSLTMRLGPACLVVPGLSCCKVPGIWSPVERLGGRGKGQVGLGVMAVEVGRGLREALFGTSPTLEP